MLNLRRPSPAMVVALVALFVSLSGTAVAAGVPLAKRALFASNSGKLQGRTARQVAAMPGPATDLQGLLPQEIAAMPSPASTASSLVVSASAPFALAPNEGKDFSAACPGGAKAIAGGYTSANAVLGWDTRPTADGNGWTLFVGNESTTLSATGTVYAVCLR
jgi:hypothetical protein